MFWTEFARSKGNPLLEGGAVARFLHRVFQRGHQFFINARDVNLMNQNLVVLVHIDVYNHMIVGCHIFVLHHVHFDIFVAFFLKILFDAEFRAIHQVGRHLIAHTQGHTLLQFFALRLFQTIPSQGGDTGLRGEFEMKIDFIANNAVCLHLHVRKQSLFPIVLHGTRNVIARHGIGATHF